MSVCTAILEYMKLSRFQVQDKAETLSNKKIYSPVQTHRTSFDKYNIFLFFIQTPDLSPSKPNPSFYLKNTVCLHVVR